MLTEKLLQDYVDNHTKKEPVYIETVELAMNTISGDVPNHLKLGIALSELTAFASCLRKPVKLYDGTIVPVNSISVLLSASGTSKDKSLNAVRKSLSRAYEDLKSRRVDNARSRAEKAAEDATGSSEDWVRYYHAPKPLLSGLGTVEGINASFADIAEEEYGAGILLSNEVGSDLQSNGNMIDIIKLVSISYDLGNIAAKVIKSSENQTKEITGLPVNALLFGSQEAILYDNAIRTKFKMVFNTQLARRSTFTFTPEVPMPPNVNTTDELIAFRTKEKLRVVNAQEVLNSETYDLLTTTTHEPLELTKEASDLFDLYLELNTIKADAISSKYPMAKLSQKHLQWRALKLAGAYSIFTKLPNIPVEMYATAINTVELLSNDLLKFEKLLNREPYEQLADYCRLNAEDGEFILTLHELRKLSYITGTGTSKSKVEELCTLAGSYDEEGSYFSDTEGITYKKLIKTDTVGVSYKIFEELDLEGKKLKDYMNRNSTDGYDFLETDFSDLGNLLCKNAIYSCFQFTDGVHTKSNLIGGTKMAVLDIDTSVITDEEAHALLEEYNHFITRTSDVDNPFKFRVLLELDAIVGVDAITWKAFIQEIAGELGLTVDPIPQSQIILSYENRNILSQLEGIPLNSKMLLDRAAVATKDRPKSPSKLAPKEKSSKLADARTTFSIGFECEQGERSTTMYKVLKYAADLGADEQYIRTLAADINNYWAVSMDEGRLERTLITPIVRGL